jgi:hypothetical protein
MCAAPPRARGGGTSSKVAMIRAAADPAARESQIFMSPLNRASFRSLVLMCLATAGVGIFPEFNANIVGLIEVIEEFRPGGVGGL